MFSATDLANAVQVVRACHAGGDFQQRMAAVAEALRPLVPFSQLSTLMVHFDARRPPEPGFVYAAGIEASRFDDYATYHHQLDPSLPVLRRARGRPRLSSEFIPNATYGRTEYTRDCLEALDIRWICGSLSDMPDGWSMVYSIQRDRSHADFKAREIETVRVLLPDIERAAYGALLERKLARRGDPPADDEAVAELTREGDVLRVTPAALRVLRRIDHEELVAALRSALGVYARAGGPWSVTRELPLQDGGRLRVVFALGAGDAAVMALLQATPPDSSCALGGELASLTPRERDVARLVARGLANKEIAVRLGISSETVKVHVARACRKTGCEGRTALAVHVERALRGRE